MAVVNITLEVNFTSHYIGEHRICWRIQGSGDPYDCTNLVICPNGACTSSFTISLESNFCGPYTIEGYVQPTCFDQSDPTGQVPFSAEYNNTVDCEPYTLTCSTVSLDGWIHIVDYGSGYTAAPLISIGGNATAISVIEATDDGMKTASINTPGTGYFSGGYGKARNITAIPGVGPAGIDARFDVTVQAGVVIQIDIRSGGTGWAIGNQFTFDNTDLGGSGSDFVGTVDTLSVIGELKEIQLTSPGSGYTAVPAVIVAPPSGPGTQANAFSKLAGCQSISGELLGPNCDLTPREDIVSVPLNTVIRFCNPSFSPPLGGYPVGWVQGSGECCYLPCTCYQMTLDDGGTVEYYYTDCTTGSLVYGIFTDDGAHTETLNNVVEGSLTAIWNEGTGAAFLCP